MLLRFLHLVVADEEVLFLLDRDAVRDWEGGLRLLLVLFEVGVKGDVLALSHLDVMHRVALSVVLYVDRSVLSCYSLLLEVVPTVVDRVRVLLRDLRDGNVVIYQVMVASPQFGED